MDNLYKIITILFVLSLISERVANFFKLRLSGSRVRLKHNNFFSRLITFNNTRIKKTDQAEEKDREFRILKINLFFGFVIAISFHADLFQLLAHIDNPNEYLSWAKAELGGLPITLESAWKFIQTIIGCLLTGAFLSFGSKFWHDALDLLLEIKNYRGVLTTKVEQDINSSATTMGDKELDTLMRSAIQDNYQQWKVNYPNIVGCTVGLKRTANATVAQKAIIFKVNDKVTASNLPDGATIPEIIEYRGTKLHTDVIQTGNVIALLGLITESGNEYSPSRLGTNLSRDNSAVYGTAGLKVKKMKTDGTADHFLLTCFHVLFPENLDPIVLSNGPIQVDINTNSKDTLVTIPSFSYRNANNMAKPKLTGYARSGLLSSRIDAGLISIISNSLEQKTFDQTLVKGEIPISELYGGLRVTSYGCVTGRLQGNINDVDVPFTEVVFKNGKVAFSHTFNHLLQVSMPCREGDSGAPVLTDDGRFVGIITSGDDTGSYVLPFQFIKNTLFVTL